MVRVLQFCPMKIYDNATRIFWTGFYFPLKYLLPSLPFLCHECGCNVSVPAATLLPWECQSCHPWHHWTTEPTLASAFLKTYLGKSAFIFVKATVWNFYCLKLGASLATGKLITEVQVLWAMPLVLPLVTEKRDSVGLRTDPGKLRELAWGSRKNV